ncbi:MAG: heavy metal-responsive transcriptional regulator [Acidimicrobiia bacterium]|nr:heavy metal-responsive transcriptional regulator [Acidimicrobiia bacterium]
MRIGELSQRAAVPTKTIRYYEDIGLLPEPERSENGYREYDDDAIARLRFIRDAQASGLTLTEIGSIVDLRDRGQTTCDHVVDLLERHLKDLEAHISDLQRTRDQLTVMTKRAKKLNPADCTDPNRCQTIGEDALVRRPRTANHVHSAPHSHAHP